MKSLAWTIRQAVKAENAKQCGNIASALRASGLRYSAIYRLVSNLTGISAAAWDALMYEADDISARE